MPLAYGKAILAGEHAVVYGYPAVAVALQRGIRCEVRESPDPKGPSFLSVPNWELEAKADEESPLGVLLSKIQNEDAGGRALEYQVFADIPPGAGLGSSAALSIALLRATDRWADTDRPHSELASRANVLEEQFHEKPSGIDVALSLGGGAIRFQKGGSNTVLDASWLSLVVANSGEQRKTSDMVKRVASFLPAKERGLAIMGEAADLAASAIASENIVQLGQAMERCQKELAEFGLVTERLKRLCEVARDAGAVAAKITGGGGGGAIIALAPGLEEDVATALSEITESKSDVFVSKLAPLSG